MKLAAIYIIYLYMLIAYAFCVITSYAWPYIVISVIGIIYIIDMQLSSSKYLRCKCTYLMK